MKKRILLVAFVFAIGMSSVLANTVDGVNEKVLNSFQKEFAGAKDMYWQKGDAFLKVSFTLNDKVLFAYYNESGEKLALVRNITSFDLPLGLQIELKQDYGQYWITDLFEFNGQEDSAYYVTVENADVKVTLKSSGMNGWIVYKRAQK
jgi:hypothetical protein